MGKGGGCSFTVSSFPGSGGFGKHRSVCSWAGAGGFKANPAPAVAEAGRAPAFLLFIGDSLLPAKLKLVRAL